VATFVKKSNAKRFLEDTANAMKIDLSRIFVHTIGDNDQEYLVTVSIGGGVKASDVFEHPIIVHTKNGSIFSINALNVLIDGKIGEMDKKVDRKEYQVNWDEYKSKLIMLNNGALRVTDITKIEDNATIS
jgi:hypothetical protein